MGVLPPLSVTASAFNTANTSQRMYPIKQRWFQAVTPGTSRGLLNIQHAASQGVTVQSQLLHYTDVLH